ncbi:MULTISPECIES: capsular polysaccharide export protein, LipB/KpsS family [Burkholderia]|nr:MULTISPECIES: capsular biosynthesis protein [Burkholderia]MBG0881586.1 capsular biosynthesis protein [Burkholderia sp. 9775_39]MBG0888173.1 capsular biosynthesis protein [Burkholderia sp. 9773_38]RSC44945.1 capsular biosynthesis protein [Burkholderia cenocepacia]
MASPMSRALEIIGLRRPLFYPGPIWSVRDDNAAPLSWFAVPIGGNRSDTLISALDTALATSDAEGERPDVPNLMRRVVDTDALHVRRQVVALPPEWYDDASRERVVMVDERTTSFVDVCTPASERSSHFLAMVGFVANRHPDARIWLLQSADAGTGAWLSEKAPLPPGIRKLAVSHSLRDVLATANALYVTGASEGMAALFSGKTLHVFGTPYYAGWGLTVDHTPQSLRTCKPSVESLFDAIFLRAARYLDPETHHIGTFESVLRYIELQHEIASRFADLRHVAGVAFQWWKRPFATPYLSAGGGTLRWISVASQIGRDEQAAIWGGRSADRLPRDSMHFRIEDGFLHSNGLGSDMSPPFSQVIDRRGIYFDATRANDLTAILNTATFADDELSRARQLRNSIVRFGLTKYNLGRCAPVWKAPAGKRVVLVPGQVADDASIRLGTGHISTAESLLAEVRSRRPDAFVVYKPHPDVLSGNRRGLVDVTIHADIVDTSADLISLIEAADEVHTLSSLSGFEAMLRDKEVHTYGLPFYAGWGLTHDVLPQPRRERHLTIDMLVAGTYLRYPIYWDWKLQLYTTPEAIVRQLAPTAVRPLEKINGKRLRIFLKMFRWSRNAIMHISWRIRTSREMRDAQPRN